MMSVQNVPMRITSLRKEAKRDPAAFAPKMHQRAGLGANFRGSCNCIILDMATDPACGSGSLLLKAAKILGKENVRQGFYGQEINLTTYNLCRINMFLHDIDFDKFDIAHEDTLVSPQHWDDEPFEVIVSNPLTQSSGRAMTTLF